METVNNVKEKRKKIDDLMSRTNIPHEVDPLKNVKDIAKIKNYFRGKVSRYDGQPDLRDYCLFVVGINIGLRAGDLLRLTIDDVYDIENDRIRTTVRGLEEKTNKIREFELNGSAQEAIKLYLSTRKNLEPNQFLFISRKGNNSPLTVQSLHKLLKTTFREFNIKGNYGTHTLRKTFAYHVYNKEVGSNPGIIQTLQRMLNHSSQSETLKYIGITKEVIKNVYQGLNL